MTVFLLILVLALSAFFSGIEIAFFSINKLKIEIEKNKGNQAGLILSEFYDNKSAFIHTLLIGNNIALVFFGMLMAQFIPTDFLAYRLHLNEGLTVLIQTLITTLVVLLFGEFFPKAIFKLFADNLLFFFAKFLKYFVYYPLRPLSFLLSSFSNLLMKLFFKGDVNDEDDELTTLDLEYLVREASEEGANNNEESEIDAEIFERALYLKDVKVRECMVPRMEIEAIENTASIEELTEKIISTKHSRILVFKENVDNIIGYVHHFELMKKPESIVSILRAIPIVTESMNARDLLFTFIKEQKNIACVVDEYGGTAGMVTLEDLLEEIFGEIEDEHDTEDYIEKKIDDKTYVFSARLEVDYINEKYGLNLPVGEYETLAGMIVTEHEDIPKQDEEVKISHFLFKIIEANNRVIDTVQIQVLNEGE